MNRRGFLRTILASGVAPYVCTAAGVLMPVKKLVVPVGFTLEELKRSVFVQRNPGDLVIIRKLIPFANVMDMKSGEYVPGSFGYLDISVPLDEYKKRYRAEGWTAVPTAPSPAALGQ